MIHYLFKRATDEGTVGDAEVTWWIPTPGASSWKAALDLRLDLANHSPTGFQWGYAGSGPAQLALAICAHALDNDTRALRCYMQIKDEFFTNEHRDVFELTDEQILEAIGEIEKNMRVQIPIYDYRNGREQTSFLDTNAHVLEQILEQQREIVKLEPCTFLVTREWADQFTTTQKEPS